MNRYEVKVRTDKTLIVEATSKAEAERTALEDIDSCRGYAFMRSVVGIKDLTGKPYGLLTELAMEVEAAAFAQGPYCKYCGAGGVASHSATCIIERARHCVREHERKDQT
jgi:hypothetical protein